MTVSSLLRFFASKLISLLLLVTLAPCVTPAQTRTPQAAPQEKQKIRAITAFLNLDRAQY